MAFPNNNRILSIDAYRGFVMLAMVSGGLAIARTVGLHPELLEGSKGHWWQLGAYQLEHVPWAGCSFWDLIQPSFMFLVGVSMPFSAEARLSQDAKPAGLFLRAVLRSVILVGLGILLYSQATGFLNFKLVNVLTQIGLGYMFVYVLLQRSLWVHLAAIAVILGGSWFAFYSHTPSADAKDQVAQYLKENAGDRLLANYTEATEAGDVDENQVISVDEAVAAEIGQYDDEMRAHWNKHTNAAGAWDRWFLNLFPRNEKPWNEKGFWVNNGGYQTLNFVPSIATMIFGLIAGLILISDYKPSGKLLRLLGFSLFCFVAAFAMDTELWPVQIEGATWSVCPIVKRIWTPSWALFSSGWTFAIMATFYLVVDVMKFRLWTFPFAIVGMNSIAVYCLAQLTQGWFATMLGNTLRTADAMFGTTATDVIYGDGMFAPIYQSIAMVAMIWLVSLWMYRRKLFVRI